MAFMNCNAYIDEVMRALADSVLQPPGKSGLSCFDPTIAERLRDAAAQAEQPGELKLREAVFNEKARRRRKCR
jgi:hypothetical protein